MGIVFNYDIALPGSLSLADAAARVEALRRRCAELPFERIEGETDAYDAAALPARRRDDGWFWADLNVRVAPDRDDGIVIVDDFVTAEALEAACFFTAPGEGAEPAFFGVARHPDAIHVDGRAFAVPDHGGRWFGRWHCKTQYAGDPRAGGVAQFLRCHLTLVAALDAARELGFDVRVADEAGYWQRRDPVALIAELHRWDAMVAGVAGHIKDRLGKEAVAGAMDGRPDFERLEAGARRSMEIPDDAVVARLIDITRADR